MMKARKSTLDGGLYELASATSFEDIYLTESSAEAPAPVSLPDIGMLETAAAPPARPRIAAPAEMVSLKLLTAPASDTDFAARVGDLGGEVVSEGPQVLLANIPRARISELDQIPGLRRAEQARRQVEAYLDRHPWDIAADENSWHRYQARRMRLEYAGDDW